MDFLLRESSFERLRGRIASLQPAGETKVRARVLAELNRSFKKTIVMVTHDSRAERFVETTFRLDKDGERRGR